MRILSESGNWNWEIEIGAGSNDWKKANLKRHVKKCVIESVFLIFHSDFISALKHTS